MRSPRQNRRRSLRDKPFSVHLTVGQADSMWERANSAYQVFARDTAVAMIEHFERLVDGTRKAPPPSPPMVVSPKLFEQLVTAGWLDAAGNWKANP